MNNNSGKTALKRTKLSAPAQKLMELSKPEQSVFDMGCGHGTDLEHFKFWSRLAIGYDPNHAPEMQPDEVAKTVQFDWVLCSYVLNVVGPEVRKKVLAQIKALLAKGGRAVIAVWSAADINKCWKPEWREHQDGWITTSGTFQKGFTIRELMDMVCDAGLECRRIPASAPMVEARMV